MDEYREVALLLMRFREEVRTKFIFCWRDKTALPTIDKSAILAHSLKNYSFRAKSIHGKSFRAVFKSDELSNHIQCLIEKGSKTDHMLTKASY